MICFDENKKTTSKINNIKNQPVLFHVWSQEFPEFLKIKTFKLSLFIWYISPILASISAPCLT
jgi:hypothetical protein